MNEYFNYIKEISLLIKKAKNIKVNWAKKTPNLSSKKALFFAPHPDDESINALLPIRLMNESNYAITACSVTLGSDEARRNSRAKEFENACSFLGFNSIICKESSSVKFSINLKKSNPLFWQKCVFEIVNILKKTNPNIVFLAHKDDANATHRAVHFLIADALKIYKKEIFVIYTEFWKQMNNPNLMIESSDENLAKIISAISLHKGEVSRNPYHIKIPFLMIDNVRRGSELICGKGAKSSDMLFATIYKICLFTKNAKFKNLTNKKLILKEQNIEEIFS